MKVIGRWMKVGEGLKSRDGRGSPCPESRPWSLVRRRDRTTTKTVPERKLGSERLGVPEEPLEKT